MVPIPLSEQEETILQLLIENSKLKDENYKLKEELDRLKWSLEEKD